VPRIEATLARLGGRLVGFWWTLGEVDSMILIELPDAAALTAFKAFAASLGGFHTFRVVPLLSDELAIQALGQAATLRRLPERGRGVVEGRVP
jgi:uncharacterized protein with GYD domain